MTMTKGYRLVALEAVRDTTGTGTGYSPDDDGDDSSNGSGTAPAVSLISTMTEEE